MSQFIFYFQHAARNLWRSRRWSAFAILSVAAGVAAVVALRSLGLAIGDSLTDNLRSSNKGDIAIQVNSDGFISFNGGTSQEEAVFTRAQMAMIRQMAIERDWEIVDYRFNGGMQLTRIGETEVGRPQLISVFYIDPDTYPITQDIYAQDPPGVPLGDLFQGGNEVVISRNLADRSSIEVGDTVQLSGTDTNFIVRGIVPTESQSGLRQFLSRELLSVIFGFAYFDRDLAGTVVPGVRAPNRISINLPEGASESEIYQSEIDAVTTLSGGQYFIESDTVPEILKENEFIADVLGRFIVIMGLGALLLGGVGIINTMLVMVRRRTTEIATLKTFGLKGRQVAMLFMTEALLLGFLGSLVGCVIGVLLSSFANIYGATLIQQPLHWRLYPEAVLFGLALGMIVTGVFGVLPVLTAARVRPAIILRPNETYIPVMGIFHAILALLFIVLTIGLIAGQILNNILVGIIAVAITLILLGILILNFWVIVWLVSKLPAFGSVDLRLALRNLGTRRFRTATTLLALSAGMFALSSIAFFGAGARDILQFTFSRALGGNVLLLPVLPPQLADPLITNLETRLDEMDGVVYRTRLQTYFGTVTSVQQAGSEIVPVDFERAIITIRDTTDPNPDPGDLIAGRYLLPEDRARQVAIYTPRDRYDDADMQVGSIVYVNVRGRVGDPVALEIVGVRANTSGTYLPSEVFGGDFEVPPRAFGNLRPGFQFSLAQVDPEYLNDVLLQLSRMLFVVAIDISLVDSVLVRLLDLFSALPILVGILSLGAAAVIMANTVALSTLERRQQIGILKAIGLKGGRVLRIMLLENTLISLLGGILGLGLSAIGVLIMRVSGFEEVMLIPADATPVAILLVIAAVAIGVMATLLSVSMAVRERVLNVLRYD